jgi:hypothetical protein
MMDMVIIFLSLYLALNVSITRECVAIRACTDPVAPVLCHSIQQSGPPNATSISVDSKPCNSYIRSLSRHKSRKQEDSSRYSQALEASRLLFVVHDQHRHIECKPRPCDSASPPDNPFLCTSAHNSALEGAADD